MNQNCEMRSWHSGLLAAAIIGHFKGFKVTNVLNAAKSRQSVIDAGGGKEKP
jgi:hypothetical protein